MLESLSMCLIACLLSPASLAVYADLIVENPIKEYWSTVLIAACLIILLIVAVVLLIYIFRKPKK